MCIVVVVVLCERADITPSMRLAENNKVSMMSIPPPRISLVMK
jgi:hypothetical protein